jgi:pyruvate,water dikinase
MNSDIFLFKQLMSKDQFQAGGKGETLARLSRLGYPVPNGFVVLPSAFIDDLLTPNAWTQVKEFLGEMRRIGDGDSFAVRSSALSEDSPHASFAGEFETILNVKNDQDILGAIQSVRRSRSSKRVRNYSRAKGMEEIQEMAVIVQSMVSADLSGILFTADPITGSRSKMLGNFVYGLGDKLVSGEVDGQGFTLHQPYGRFEGPAYLKTIARKLFRLASRLENDLGAPQDIEWSVADGNIYILQSRPITNLVSHDHTTGEWNDSLSGNYLWSNVNFGEAVTESMTPLAWSVLQFTLEDWVFLPGFSTTGSIGGNPYLNISIFASLFNALGRSREDLLKMMEGTLYMSIPDQMEIPLIPLTLKDLFGALKCILRLGIKQQQGVKRLPQYLLSNPEWFRQTRQKLQSTQTKSELLTLWENNIAPRVKKGAWIVLGTVNETSNYTLTLKRKLTALVGPEDATILIANVSAETELLPSLGPVVGLAKVANGEMTRDDYLEKYGHRGPHEFEISKPRPVEDLEWFDSQLEHFLKDPIDIDEMILRQQEIFRSTWMQFVEKFSKKTRSVRRQIAESARRSRLREEARSEYIRDRWIVRLFALRAGDLTGLGADIFFLYLDEVMSILEGNETAVGFIPARKKTYKRYLDLPPFPSIISGRFNPFEWAADPDRQSNIYIAHTSHPGAKGRDGNIIFGSPGSAGHVEGFVRVLGIAEEGDQLKNGEILVTTQTDISWTVLFPRAAAVITDIGAPLSHAAIVARELGIPAVVGCGDATMRLKTGDRVRVDGGRGKVYIL